MSAELQAVTTAVAEFDRVAAGLAELQSKYKGVVYDVATTKGMTEAKEARRAIREPRIEVEKIRKSAKAPILALGKKLDTEAARITKALEELEEPIDVQIKDFEMQKERERQATVEAELKRVADLQERVAELRGRPSLSASSGSELIAGYIQDLEKIEVDDTFQEFRQRAEDAKAAGLSRLRDLHAAALAHETEQARIKAEREELTRLRAQEEERQAAERARLAEEERKAHLEREADAARHAEQLRQQREEQERLQRERQAVIDAENARVRAEQDAERARIAAERAEIERKAREQREAQEAEERRIAAEREALERAQREAREVEERRAETERIRRENREQVERLTAEDIVRWLSSEYGCEWSLVAARIASIPHEDWVALAVSEQTEAA